MTPRRFEVKLEYASGDLGDVSHLCPVGELMTATWAVGTPGHSWQAVAQGKAPLAHKGMLYAAKVMAGAGIDLINNPDKLAQAKEELAQALADDPYTCPIPAETPIPYIS